ncbi:GNAT family N-acetyltransferase [[Clostridium] dakarense]|uniref:GNAT family N-acetyltransferase n=1 Tax=Faecalimicrobium dakarense TaxID=1301100 RepID=UPI0004B5FD34|nr:N-acetyltransferase [[Clostridium] dakarense]
MNIKIRQENEKDYKVSEDLVKLAFENEEFSDKSEHLLVNRLRKGNSFIKELSMVVEDNEKIVGHILFTKALIDNGKEKFETLALAPLSVLPKYQGKGIGSKLIKEGLKKAKEMGYKSVIVLGHDKYYPRFGFIPASNYDIKAPFEVPNEAFMALELIPNGLENISGTVVYAKEFLI